MVSIFIGYIILLYIHLWVSSPVQTIPLQYIFVVHDQSDRKCKTFPSAGYGLQRQQVRFIPKLVPPYLDIKVFCMPVAGIKYYCFHNSAELYVLGESMRACIGRSQSQHVHHICKCRALHVNILATTLKTLLYSIRIVACTQIVMKGIVGKQLMCFRPACTFVV